MNMENIKNLLKNRKVGTIGNHKFFSVLVPLVEIENEIYILYEIRSKTIPSQPGEICFPGGKIEDNETPIQAALRETEEEIGIKRENIEIISEGDRLISQANFTIFSYYGNIGKKDYDNIILNKSEVNEVFLVPIKWFLKAEPEIYTMDLKQFNRPNFPFDKVKISRDYKWMGSSAESPIYIYEDKPIWGLTGRITRNLIQIIKKEKK